MLWVKVHERCERCYELAINVLEKGGLIIYPTDTAYGLGADIRQEDAVLKVYRVKRRPLSKPLTIALASVEMIPEYAEVDERLLKFISRFLPGRVTFILRKKGSVPDLVNPKAIGIRVPDNEVALELIRRFGRAITATSANLSGRPPKYRVSDVVKEIRVDLALDIGDLGRTEPSTIVELITGKPKLIREGPVPFQEIVRAYREEFS